MEFFIQSEHTGDYGGKYFKLRQLTADDYLNAITDITSAGLGVVSTRLTRYTVPILRWFRTFKRAYDTFIMVLDCDSTDDMLAAASMLKRDQIGYALIQSSPSRYWIVTDYCDTFNNVYAKLKSLPGVDNQWLKHAHEIAAFTLRGLSLPGKVPIFQGCDNLTNPFSIAFYKEFEALHNHPTIKRRLQAEILQEMAKNKQMVMAAANPEFEL